MIGALSRVESPHQSRFSRSPREEKKDIATHAPIPYLSSEKRIKPNEVTTSIACLSGSSCSLRGRQIARKEIVHKPNILIRSSHCGEGVIWWYVIGTRQQMRSRFDERRKFWRRRGEVISRKLIIVSSDEKRSPPFPSYTFLRPSKLWRAALGDNLGNTGNTGNKFPLELRIIKQLSIKHSSLKVHWFWKLVELSRGWETNVDQKKWWTDEFLLVTSIKELYKKRHEYPLQGTLPAGL